MTKCLYCKKELFEKKGIDVCDSCGIGVWGRRMFEAIKKNMENSGE
ncbi:hypothetical protein HYT25_01945 [Candidatus Pacearchaeota archaeon]|nr:hypothetical protein [Candidatus Pacearchaeota archaeon]